MSGGITPQNLESKSNASDRNVRPTQAQQGLPEIDKLK